MSIQRERQKFREVLNHRENWYLRVLDGVINGEFPPEYMGERWRKYKGIKPRKSL